MSDQDVFFEEWTPEQFYERGATGEYFEWTRERCELGAAAPAMVRVLVELEWNGEDGCPMCWQDHREPSVLASLGGPHDDGCALDAALTSAGLPDQASRDKLRELIEERSG